MRRHLIAFLMAALSVGLAVTLYAAVTVPAGTAIIMSLDQSVSSKDARTGQKVDCSVAQDVTVGGKTVIPKGSKGSCSVASVQASGRLKTPPKLWLKVDSIDVNGKSYKASTRWSGQTGRSHNKRNIIAIGGGSALGAIVGGIAGGGKGAAIGAAAGAGAGTAGAALTGKKDITFPAETKLRFTVKSDLVIG
ncbi:MAG TPA: hypothetical protein VKE24_08825 [Candidatus Acidoferrales bacterium]|nr:hypothetical protein [Candidatus Acidoferrales bacterium]